MSESHLPYQFFMLMLCVCVVGMMAADAAVSLDEHTASIMAWLDTGVCLIFLVDFVWRFVTAKRRWKYFITWGWLDLVSSIPFLTMARWGRLARILRIIRLIRGVKSIKALFDAVVKKRGESAILSAFFIAIMTVGFGSLAILQCERGVDGGNINTAADAVWWTVVTMSTVGYGDFFPVTLEGRLVACWLMIVGIGLFGTFTGLLASWLMGGDNLSQLKTQVATLEAENAALRASLHAHDTP